MVASDRNWMPYSGADSGRIYLSEDVCLYPCQAGHHFHDIKSSLGFEGKVVCMGCEGEPPVHPKTTPRYLYSSTHSSGVLPSRRFGFLRSGLVPKCRALVLVGDTFKPILRILSERR